MALLGFKDRFVPEVSQRKRKKRKLSKERLKNLSFENMGRELCRRLYPVLGMCERPLCFKQAAQRHHKDGNTYNNERTNIEFLCVSCHAATHRPIEKFILSNRIARRIELPGIVELFNVGMPVTGMAKHFGCSTQPIVNELRRRGLRRKYKPRPRFGKSNPAWKGGRAYKKVLFKITSCPEGPNKCPRGACALCGVDFFGRGRQKVCSICMKTAEYQTWQRQQHRAARLRFEGKHGAVWI